MATYCCDSLPFPQNAGNVGCKPENHVEREKNPKQRGSAWNARFLTWNSYFLTWFQRGSSVVPHTRNQSPVWEIWRVENVLGPQVKCCTMDRHSLQPMSIFSLASMERQNHGKSIIWNIKPLFGTDQQPVWFSVSWVWCAQTQRWGIMDAVAAALAAAKMRSEKAKALTSASAPKTPPPKPGASRSFSRGQGCGWDIFLVFLLI